MNSIDLRGSASKKGGFFCLLLRMKKTRGEK